MLKFHERTNKMSNPDHMSPEEKINFIIDERTKSTKDSVLERHAQTILISIITAAILFSASFIYNANEQVSKLDTKLEFMSVLITKLETKIDTMNGNYVQKSDFDKIEDRVRKLEQHSTN